MHTSHQTTTRHMHTARRAPVNQDQDPLLNQGLPHWRQANLVYCCVKETPLTEDNTSSTTVQNAGVGETTQNGRPVLFILRQRKYVNDTFLIPVFLHETVEKIRGENVLVKNSPAHRLLQLIRVPV